jgi:hypothetical protein
MKQGTYTVKVKAKDVFNEEGDWGYLGITMPKGINMQNKPLLFNILIHLLNDLPRPFKILKNIIGI